jgi:hypothetical protein
LHPHENFDAAKEEYREQLARISRVDKNNLDNPLNNNPAGTRSFAQDRPARRILL